MYLFLPAPAPALPSCPRDVCGCPRILDGQARASSTQGLRIQAPAPPLLVCAGRPMLHRLQPMGPPPRRTPEVCRGDRTKESLMHWLDFEIWALNMWLQLIGSTFASFGVGSSLYFALLELSRQSLRPPPRQVQAEPLCPRPQRQRPPHRPPQLPPAQPCHPPCPPSTPTCHPRARPPNPRLRRQKVRLLFCAHSPSPLLVLRRRLRLPVIYYIWAHTRNVESCPY